MYKKRPPTGITTLIKPNASDGVSHQKPVGFSVLNHNDRIEVRVRPPFEFLPFFFTVFWYGFLAVWYSIVIKGGHVFMGLIALIHVFAGLFMAKRVFDILFSRTHLIVGPSGLTLQKKRSLQKDIHVPRHELDQFYVTRSKKGINLMLQCNEVTHIELLTKMRSYGHARYIEDFLETELNIKDVEVSREIHKKNHSRDS